MSSEFIKLKQTFKEHIDKFVESCIPLTVKDSCIYFLSESSQLYGFDFGKNILFEPSSNNKFNMVGAVMETFFNEEVKKSLEERGKLRFDELVELSVKINYREKYIGRKFFWYKAEKKIYVWSMVTGKWEKSDVDSLRYVFANNEILTDPGIVKKSEKAKSLEDLGVDFADLDEIPHRFKDASLHYYHKKLGKVYSLNVPQNGWYVPGDAMQKQILVHVKGDI
ncbi:MAG: hypothetical protein Hyperionvirus15_33 [Hyperionvirus sp.]|uniref:Uncharacterized protein n=1 Tax=Hyperionvirus sp. TaxID=2487770 RepID=A0A3G5A9S9_9VIRU|nr:MAG: hypothetical protein Hyperionvirus15_33 [Hyperionvirus sp.]